MSLLASVNFGIYLVLSPSHAYNTFLLASIYFGEIISYTKFTKINGKPIFQALQYTLQLHTYSMSRKSVDWYGCLLVEECNALLALCVIYTRVMMGKKLCALIAKLEIMVWHCPGKIYIYIYNYKYREISCPLYDYICRLASLNIYETVHA